MPKVCRLGDVSDHGGTIVTASPDVNADGIGVARNGDLHSCPIPGHGITPINSTCVTRADGGRSFVRIGDTAACGAAMISGSPTVNAT